jgi:hypothetical protein
MRSVRSAQSWAWSWSPSSSADVTNHGALSSCPSYSCINWLSTTTVSRTALGFTQTSAQVTSTFPSPRVRSWPIQVGLESKCNSTSTPTLRLHGVVFRTGIALILHSSYIN